MLSAPSTPATAMQRSEKSSQTRQHILDASMHLFSTHGYPNTTVREIAQEAGITDAAIYYHFATKGDLLHELINTRLRPGHSTTECTRDASIREVVQAVMHHVARVIDENRDLLRIVLREGLAGDPAAAFRYRQLIDASESRLRGRLLPFETTGALAAGEARQLAGQIIFTTIIAFEDMLLLRPDRSVSSAGRRLQTQAFLSRCIDRLLPATCNLPNLVSGDALTGRECREYGL
jgi:AcrR family transcriptional regulator